MRLFKFLDRKFYNTLKLASICGLATKENLLKIRNLYDYNGVLTCEICKEPINSNNKRRVTSIDHIKPKCYGGSDDLDNLRIAHLKCNNYRNFKITKGNK